MVHWVEHFKEHDPFITTPQPNKNPWISDDITLWTLNTDKYSIPLP
jgi:hypothetical protein